METNKIHLGSALEVLRTFEGESVDCAITSPPYYGLRSYGTEGQVWGGKKDCEHEFGNEKSKPINLQAGNPEFKREWREQATDRKATSGSFCLHCNAWKGELGLEPTFGLYLEHLWMIFDEIKRVLKKTGTCFVNLGDSYGGSGNASGHTEETKNLSYKTSNMGATKGHKQGLMPKSLLQIPSRFSIGMTDRGWILRNSIIWYKRNCMPSSAKDRFTVDYEMMFFFTKSTKYYFEQQFEPYKLESVKRERRGHNGGKWGVDNPLPDGVHTPTMCKKREFVGYNGVEEEYENREGRNKRCVWDITPKGYREAHFAVFPPELVETPIKAGCPENGIVLDPFFGSGTTGEVALKLGRRFIGVELNEKYIKLAEKRLEKAGQLFSEVS